LTTHVLRQDLPGTPSGWDSDLLCDDTAGAGGGPLRSESARRLTPEIRQSKFPGTPRPSVTLALAAPGPPVQLRWATLRVQGPTLRDAALANDGDGSPPVARGPSPPPLADYTDRTTARLFRIAASVRGGKTRLRPATRIPTAQTALGDQVPGTGN